MQQTVVGPLLLTGQNNVYMTQPGETHPPEEVHSISLVHRQALGFSCIAALSLSPWHHRLWAVVADPASIWAHQVRP